MLRILYLEDDPDDLELARLALKRDGLHCEVHGVASREEFSRAMEGDPPDVILSDGSVPGFDGFDALAMARRRMPEVPFILVSGAVTPELDQRSRRGGAVGCVPKDELARLAPSIRLAVSAARASKKSG
jgi:CheY-like chemotaxis protein